MKKFDSSNKLLIIVVVAIAIYTMPSCKVACLLQDPVPLSPYATDLRNANHFLDSLTARSWIERYKAYKDSICNNAVGVHTPVLIDSSESFNRALIQQILCLKNCIGLRVFQGMDTNYKVHILLGGIDQYGNTLYITENGGGGLRTDLGGGSTGLGEMGHTP